MSTPELVEQVARQLARIPHAEKCWVRETITITGTEARDGEYSLPCNCGRDQRIAEAVARAYEAGIRAYDASMYVGAGQPDAEGEAAFLRSFR